MDSTELKKALTQVFDTVAPDFDQSDIAYHVPIGQQLVRVADIQSGERVLDVGTGRGAVLFAALDVVGPTGTVTGIDLSNGMVEHVRADALRLGHRNVAVHTMDGEEPDFPPGSFDAVLGSYSINMFPNAPVALRRYPELLAPGGRLAFTTPVFHEDGLPTAFPPTAAAAFHRLFEKWRAEGLPKQFLNQAESWYGTPERITETLRAAGFDSVRVEHHTVTVTVGSGADWVRWTYTEGLRMFWERIDAAERPALEAEIAAGMDAARDADGTISYPHPVCYVLAS